MRILLTAHRFWPSVGGTEEVVAQLAKRYAKAGHEVTVATSDEPGFPLEETRDGHAIRRFQLRRLGKFRFPGEDYVSFVRDGAFDIVHVHGQRVWSTDYLYKHFKDVRGRIIFTAHGFYQWHVERTPLVDAWYYGRVLPRALKHAAGVVALTDAERRELEGWGVKDVHKIPDGFDPSEFTTLPAGFRDRHAFAKDEPILLYVGGLYRNKRVDRAIEAAAVSGATLAVIGRGAGSGQARLARHAKRQGARVRFMGTLPRHEVLSAYRESDLFLLASDFEGFGLVLLEAMASGLPFVSTPAGAAPELAAAGGGVVVPPERFAKEAAALLADAPRMRLLSAGGMAAAKAYGWDPIADRYLSLFEEVSARTSPSS